ncbi:hypothetical protein [Curtobacterium sp. PhB136]|uniref:hypothetical protein n=1 Tax=Curtobacterium sp. PhB136 TaxID=2485181 RepID=UPI00104BA73B|nr:hypothetical protein [Curtobacterium sp. PhB136]TCK63136.1 hypothetical protein EDF27_2802 [Curtobacterium sp. PhB136]
MPAEAVQEQGRRGVQMVKRWLEATTFIELQWNVYENTRYCTIPLLNGSRKRWDLAGYFLTGDRQAVFVENKDYSSAGDQPNQFREFLVNCYSATARGIRDVGEENAEFLWVTTHPFGSMTQWSKLATRETVVSALEAALEEDGDFLGGAPIDPDLAAVVAERTWVLVFNRKQARLSLERHELDLALAALKRKESTL